MKRILLTFVIVSLAACADMMANLGGPKKGLLIAQIYTTKKLVNAEAIINGKYYPIEHDSDLVIELPEGEYDLEGLLTEKKTYPIQKKVTIKAGKATNLGYLAILNKRQFYRNMRSNIFDHLTKGKYIVVAVDNSQSVHQYFSKAYPKKFASRISANEVELVLDKFIDAKQLQALRSYIAVTEYEAQIPRTRYVAGPLGTVAYSIRGKASRTTVANIDSLRNMDNCAKNKYKMICLLNGNNYILLRKSKIKNGKLTGDFRPDSIFVSRKGRIFAIDKQFKVVVSRNNGRTWRSVSSVHTKARLNQPGYKHFAFYETNSNQFIFPLGQAKESTIVLRKSSKARYFKRYHIPETVDHINDIKLTKNGIVIFSGSTKLQNSRVYFKSYRSNTWKMQDFGLEACGDIGFKGRRKSIMYIKCDSNTWASKNGGKFWSQSKRK